MENVTPHYSFLLPNMGAGGAEKTAIVLANQFFKMGYLVSFIVLENTGRFTSQLNPQIRVHTLGSRQPLVAALALSKLLKRTKPTYVIGSMGLCNSILGLVNMLTRTKKTLFLGTEQSFRSGLFLDKDQQSSYKQKFKSLLSQKAYEQLDGVICCTKDVEQQLSQRLNLKGKLTTIHNPVDPRTFSESDVLGIRQTSGLFRLLAVGRLSPEKDYPTMLLALAIVSKQIDCRLRIVGEGPLLEELESMVGDLELSEVVTFTGFIEDIHPEFSEADLVVLSSKFEGLPTVLLEAVSNGLSFVSTDCPSGPREIVELIGHGGLVPIGNHMELAKAILKSFSETIDHQKIRQAALIFRPSEVANSYISFLREIAADTE
jgi:glycosyltransferase involved in cell wall biosynthesis